MSEPALYGFKKNDKYKITYCHAESDLESLGVNIVNFIENTSIEEMNSIYDKIILVYGSEEVPKNLIDKYKQYSDDDCDWYWVLRNTQGHLEYYKKDLIHMIDNGINGAMAIPDWVYIINLNNNELEIYYNKEFMDEKCFKVFKEKLKITNGKKFEYYNKCILLEIIPFKDIANKFKKLIKRYNTYDEDEIDF